MFCANESFVSGVRKRVESSGFATTDSVDLTKVADDRIASFVSSLGAVAINDDTAEFRFYHASPLAMGRLASASDRVPDDLVIADVAITMPVEAATVGLLALYDGLVEKGS